MDLREARMYLSLTQEELGRKIGRTVKTIQNMESGKSKIPLAVEIAVKSLSKKVIPSKRYGKISLPRPKVSTYAEELSALEVGQDLTLQSPNFNAARSAVSHYAKRHGFTYQTQKVDHSLKILRIS